MIILSQGSIPWLSPSHAAAYAINIGFDGIELLPFRSSIAEMSSGKNTNRIWVKNIKSIHQSWRLDTGHDKDYGIPFPQSILFTLLRLLLFPNTKESSTFIEVLVNQHKLPVVVHNTSAIWTSSTTGKRFSSDIQYEIMNMKTSPKDIEKWLQKKKHSIVVDTRDDQSLSWARLHGFSGWKELWSWIGIKNISSLQLTLIGTSGIENILNCERSLPEEQLLWLHSKKWKGTVTVEVNPISLLFKTRGQLKEGFVTMLRFVDVCLNKGRRWST